MIRFFDIAFSIIGLLLLSPIFLIVYICGLFDTGSPLFFQERVGKDRLSFVLVKFRTMRLDTQSMATHLASKKAVTRYGSFLRKSKLDELPQLWNVLKGDMSLVGPRPCLPAQHELIDARLSRDVYMVRPGITGLAQVKGVDMSSPDQLAILDQQMIQQLNLTKYFYYIFLTLLGCGMGDRVSG